MKWEWEEDQQKEDIVVVESGSLGRSRGCVMINTFCSTDLALFLECILSYHKVHYLLSISSQDLDLSYAITGFF